MGQYVSAAGALSLVALSVGPPSVRSDEAALITLMEKMEGDVLDLAKEVEVARGHRCSEDALDSCRGSNYDDCLSSFPFESCPGGSHMFAIPQCGDETSSCGGIFDFTISSVRVPGDIANDDDGNPTDSNIIETICYTRRLDEWFRTKRDDDAEFWGAHGIDTPWMHFGAHDGIFRIYPARHSEECRSYDPRERPWFISGSSGAKDVVLVLDASASVASTVVALKEAASRIVTMLTSSDRVFIVRSSNDAEAFFDNRTLSLLSATPENKEILLRVIDHLEFGSTDVQNTLSLAFASLNRTNADAKSAPRCKTAILFFTDRNATDPESGTQEDIADLVKSGKAAVENDTGRPVTIFTYSLGDDEGIHALPRRIACETDGLWTKIKDEGTLVEQMSSYYELFSFGLWEEGSKNESFVAWAHPYAFTTGNETATTVSAPVFDRSFNPPLFVGVVGIDITIEVMNRVLGAESCKEHTLNALIASKSSNFCPDFNLSVCQLESLRGEDAHCAKGNCTEEQHQVHRPGECAAVGDYPKTLWANSNNKGNSYEDRVCCEVGKEGPSDMCPRSGLLDSISDNMSEAAETISEAASGVSAGAVVGGLVVAVIAIMLAVIAYRRYARKEDLDTGKMDDFPGASHTDVDEMPDELVGTNEVVQPAVSEDTADWTKLPTLLPTPSLRAVPHSDF